MFAFLCISVQKIRKDDTEAIGKVNRRVDIILCVVRKPRFMDVITSVLPSAQWRVPKKHAYLLQCVYTNTPSPIPSPPPYVIDVR